MRRQETRLWPAIRGGVALALLMPLPSESADRPEGALEEVTVTARKREELLLHAPLALTAFSRQELEVRKLTNISEVARFTPNMEFDFTAPLSGSANMASVFIRGVGQTDYVPNKDPGVGIYLDGVYITRTAGSVLNLLDVERVEVLRGPQGTLFGKNTVGGAINVITFRPDEERKAALDVTVGSFDRLDARGYFNAPLSPTLSGRWSIGYFSRDGYLRRVLAGDRAGNDDEIAARMALRWQPASNFTANFSLDYSKANEESTATRLVSTDVRVAVSPYSIGDPQTLFAGQAYNVLIGAMGPCVPTVFGCLPPLPGDTVPYDRRWLTGDPRTSFATGPNYSKHAVLGLNATLDWSLSNLNLRSITGYRTTDANFGRDPDGSPLVIGQSEVWVDYEQLSQEFQVSSAAAGGKLEWLAGAFFLTEEGKQHDFVPFADETFQIYRRLGVPVPNFLSVNGPDSINSNDSLALFAEGSYALSANWEATLGLRWTSESRETVANTTQGGMQSVVNPRASLRFDDVSGRIILAYRPDTSQMVYSSYSEGFKSGGFNHRLAIPPPPFERLQEPTRFDPETVDTLEIGYKAGFWSGRGRLSTALFHSRYQNSQVLVFDLGVPRTINAADGEIDGLELEISLAATDRLRLDLAYGFLDAGYTRLDEDVPGAFGNPISIVPLTLDSRFVNTPEHSFAMGAEWERQLASGSALVLRVDAQFRSEVANDAVNTPELIEGELWLFSASLDWEVPICQCEISLFGENLSDEDYIVSGAADSPGSGTASAILARPREWGLRVSYRFD